MSERYYPLCPGVMLRVSPTRWYMLDWDGRALSEVDISLAVVTLTEWIREHRPEPATEPARRVEEHFRSAEEALEDLCLWRGASIY